MRVCGRGSRRSVGSLFCGQVLGGPGRSWEGFGREGRRGESLAERRVWGESERFWERGEERFRAVMFCYVEVFSAFGKGKETPS